MDSNRITRRQFVASSSAALAAGGGTCFFDMPLNSEPPVLDAARLREKRSLAEEKSCVDFALWGGVFQGLPMTDVDDQIEAYIIEKVAATEL